MGTSTTGSRPSFLEFSDDDSTELAQMEKLAPPETNNRSEFSEGDDTELDQMDMSAPS